MLQMAACRSDFIAARLFFAHFGFDLLSYTLLGGMAQVEYRGDHGQTADTVERRERDRRE